MYRCKEKYGRVEESDLLMHIIHRKIETFSCHDVDNDGTDGYDGTLF